VSLLEVRDLRVRFETPLGTLRAVDGISFDLEEGETLGLVGESGSGKSVSILAIMGLVPTPPGVVEAGAIRFRGQELTALAPSRLRALRGKDLAMIFQDPMTCLNPLLTIGLQLSEVLEVHLGLSRREGLKCAAAALGEVGIPEPEGSLACYPHEFSGGMRQRVMIAMALLCRPAVLFADEPTTALDVTIQAQILELLVNLQRDHGTAIVLVTHDLGVVAGRADRVQVMYAGRLVESAPTTPLFETPLHPYTRGLLASVPRLDREPESTLASIDGQPPDLLAPPGGCAFAPRCSLAVEACREATPELESPMDGRLVACPRHAETPVENPAEGAAS